MLCNFILLLFTCRMMNFIKQRLPKSFLTYLLVIGFGIGSWVAINGIWAEISVLVIVCPECYDLPALIVVVIQVANVGPLLYAIAKYFFHRFKWDSYQLHFDVAVILGLVAIGILSSALLAAFWDRNTAIFGEVHSVALIVLVFFLSIVDCTSSVVFIPFMKHFPEEYLSALYIGEGMSGVLPTVASLSQGSVRNSASCNGTYTGYQELGLRFSPHVYFLLMTAMMLVCGFSFLCIISLPAVRKHMLHRRKESGGSDKVGRDEGVYAEVDNESAKDEEDALLLEKDGDGHILKEGEGEDGWLEEQDEQEREGSSKEISQITSPRKFNQTEPEQVDSVALLSSSEDVHHQTFLFSIVRVLYSNAVLYVCMGIISFLSNGALNSISSFVFIPYGSSVYHIAVDLALLAAPLMSAFFHLCPAKSKVVVVINTAIISILGIYLIIVATMYPTPFLRTSLIGKILIVSFHEMY